MAHVLQYLPDADGDELVYLNTLFSGLTEEQAQQFTMIYRSRRTDPTMILVLSILGFVPIVGVPIAGIQRFTLGQVGMGILYVVTFGLCGVGTIMDIVNHKRMSAQYNQQKAYEVATIMRSLGQL
jgi:TM2 domain-containing membrane protein YozV